jgi:hypothetical protein
MQLFRSSVSPLFHAFPRANGRQGLSSQFGFSSHPSAQGLSLGLFSSSVESVKRSSPDQKPAFHSPWTTQVFFPFFLFLLYLSQSLIGKTEGPFLIRMTGFPKFSFRRDILRTVNSFFFFLFRLFVWEVMSEWLLCADKELCDSSKNIRVVSDSC